MLLVIPFVVSLGAIAFSAYSIRNLLSIKVNNQKAIELSGIIQEAAAAYLKRQYRTIAVVGFFVAALLFAFLGWKTALGFVVGGVASGIAGYIGMVVSVKLNATVADRSSRGVIDSFKVAFSGGSVTGFLVAGLALLVVTGFYAIFKNDFIEDPAPLIGLAFGGSLLSVFARIGGGIFTKAADVGADLVGKVEVGIPEDDPRNPAVIADLVGDNVGDNAGMAADVFETFVVSVTSTMLLGSLLFPGVSGAIVLPLLIASVGIIASIFSVQLVNMTTTPNVMRNLYLAVAGSIVLSTFFLFPTISWAMTGNIQYSNMALFFSTLMGFIVTGGVFFITDYYTSKNFSPVKKIAEASKGGHAPNIITGLAVGMEATAMPVVLIVIGLLASFWLAGLYGVALAVMGMLSLAGVIVTLDAFGPISDNAGGIAEMADFPEKSRMATDELDSAGNTTKAVTKGYAITSAALAALVLFAAYKHEIASRVGGIEFQLDSPQVIAGLFLGGVVSYLFSSMCMSAVARSAMKVVEEVRRQFREIKGIMDGSGKPDYTQAVDIVTQSAIREMMYPAALAVLAPIIIGFALGVEVLGGFLMGSIVTGIFLAISMTSGGGAWDNAKKYIEDGKFGGKGSDAHKAAVTGDTVGDPYKDTAGPAINPMIKVLNIIALLIVPFLV